MSDIKNINVVSINHEKLSRVIKRCYYTKTPVFITGGIGIGKSSGIRKAGIELATENKLEFVETKEPNKHLDKFCLLDMRLAQKEVGDVLGLPENYAMIRVDGMYEMVPSKILDTYLKTKPNIDFKDIHYCTKWTAPSWYPRDGKGIMFIDEFNLTPPLIQYAFYELINDRALGDYKLPDGWLVVAAGNRGQLDGTPEFEFPPPLNNRFSWYELSIPTVEEWVEWAIPNGIDLRIIGYLYTKRSALYNYKRNSKEKCFPTPRGWHRVSNLIKGVEDEDEIELYTSGVVGKFYAEEFKAFLQNKRKLPPVEDFIKKPSTIKLPEENDLVYTLATNLCEYYASRPDKEKLQVLSAIVTIAKRLWQESNKREFGFFYIKLAKMIDEKFFIRNVMNIPEFKSLYPSIYSSLGVKYE